MKVLVFTRYDILGASSRIRMLQYLPRLELAGFEMVVVPQFFNTYIANLQKGKKSPGEIFHSYLRRLLNLWRSREFNLVWIEKECLPWLPVWVEQALLSSKVPYVLDYDDAVFHRYDQHSYYLVRRFLAGKHPALMRNAALVVAGNDYLANFALNAGASWVEIIPSVVDLDRYQWVNNPENDDSELSPCVGWIGQRSTAEYLKPLAPLFYKLSDEHKARFAAIGIDAASLGLPMSSIPWSEQSEVSFMRSFDIGIMPLTDGTFERGKCGFKLIQYMACGLPVIASPVGVNCQIVEHGVNGFLASTVDEWAEALNLLLEDKALRQRMGEAGRAKVEREYCLQVTAPKLVDLLCRVGNR